MGMLTRMQIGRFKVFTYFDDWWEEFRLCHRRESTVVKEGDDPMSVTKANMTIALRNVCF